MKLSTTIKFLPGHAGIDMEHVLEAERLGFDAVWAGEAYGTDAVSPVAWVLARTSRIKAGTSIMQMPARTPACAAMTAMTLQALSGNRFLCGIGPSGPQVVEGWHGVRFGKPLDFSRYAGLESDRLVLRAVTDEIMYAIMALASQEYVDEDAQHAKATLKAERKVHASTGGQSGT